MSSRDSKDTKSLQDKLKVFFKKGGPAGTLPARSELVVTAELERELGPEAPLHRRLRALKDVAEKAVHLRVHEGDVEKLWTCTRDMLEDSNVEARHSALWLMRCVAEGQADHLQLMRTILFRYLRETHATRPADDDPLRFKLLHTLTNTGKNINCFEEEIGPFLLEWLPQIQPAAQLVEFLQLITNIVKFNATYLDEDIVHGIVDNACHLCVYSGETGVVCGALALLEAVVSYSLLPRRALSAFVCALCRAVNVETYCEPAWRLMRSVLGGDVGPAALHRLVEVLRATDTGDAGLVRGAVFYINMALWGQRRVPALRASLLAVLPALHKALHGARPIVVYEVAVAVQGCVARASPDLSEPAWDVLLRILRAILAHDEAYDPPNEMIHTRLHDIITQIEQLADAGQYEGEPGALLDLVEACAGARPESSALRLVSARAAALTGAAAALALGERFVRLEARRAVRLHALGLLAAWLRGAAPLAPELLESVAAPTLAACAGDADAALRAAAARALAELARVAPPDACTDLVDLLERILNRPFEMYVTDVPIPADADVSDLRLAVQGLLELLHARLLATPPALPMRCLLVLLDHLDAHYRRPALFRHHPEVRLRIFEMLFGLRANEYNCLGFCYGPGGEMVWGEPSLRMRPVCSPFLVTEPPSTRHHPAGAAGTAGGAVRELATAGAVSVSAARIARPVCACVSREAEWAALGPVLRALPALLWTRAPAAGRRAAELDALAAALCALLGDRSVPRAPPSLSDLHGAALPALAALAPHHAALDPLTQQRTVWCLLKYGMVLRCPQPYINALTLFTLEARDTMVKMLPEVLLDLSKISDTQAIASPMLEFLSTLTRLPKVFASFVEDQYMSVFAILLPYTNPSRYNHYVVSLAHHVIAAWFLKCRLSYRKNFVKFIIHGLHNYIIMPFEEQLQFKSNNFQQNANEDSSNRQRSSSLGSRAVPRSGGGTRGTAGGALAAFHVELTETCVDLLARYASSPCSVKPTRSDTATFLFTGGHSMTWLVGHKLVTITTSGCQQNALKAGLCDRCALLCKHHADSLTALEPDVKEIVNQSQIQVQVSEEGADTTTTAAEVKRYSKRSLQHSRSTDSSSLSVSDLQLAVSGSVSASASGHTTSYSKRSLQHSRSTDSSSLSVSDLQLAVSGSVSASASGHTTRQNSSENSKATDPLVEVLNHFQQRFEKISKEVDSEEANWFRLGGVAAGGGCPCWCAQWAEVHVRSAAGDVSWLMRIQNQMSWDYLSECPLQEVAALLSPPASAPTPAQPTPAQPAPAQPTPATDLHKSSSDTVVSTAERRAPHAASQSTAPATATSQPLSRMCTQPINIPGSPQRQSSSSTTDDDDMLLIMPEGGDGPTGLVGRQGKARHPVRRSNSSPEMSGEWRAPAPPPAPAPPASPVPHPLHVDDMILLPSCEPQVPGGAGGGGATCKKPGKKSDMRVSCEAIPEEMSGTSPHNNHHHLMTFNSDPALTGARMLAGTVPSPGVAAPTPAGDGALAHGNTHHQLQKTSSDGTVGGARRRDELPPLARSKRSNTISVMSPTRRQRPAPAAGTATGPTGAGGSSSVGPGAGGGGVTPAFVFLQLYHNMSTYPITPPVPGEVQSMLSPGAERPLRVHGAQHERTVKNLDLVPPIETYKVGVLYVGVGQQDDEVAILRNEYGSVRYADFLRQLGSLVPLGGPDPPPFLNLETGGADGQYTYVWQDDIMQVLFHVATAMPTTSQDPSCNEKRKYIGNDYVSIVYNDSGAEFSMNTIKGQLCACCVLVEPHAHGMNLVSLATRDERIRGQFLAHVTRACVSDAGCALLARQLALHAALAAHIAQSLRLQAPPYAGNSLERLRAVKRLRRRLEAERAAHAARAPAPYAPPAPTHRHHIDDFNDYT